MSSFISGISPAAPEPMPWNWNPGATFVRAFNDEQENRRAQQEFETAQEMERILFPIKQQQAQLALEKMNLEMERTKGEIERQRILTRQMTDTTRNVNRGFNGALLEGPATPSRYGGAVANLIQAYQSGALKPSGGTKKLGEGYTGNE